MNEARMAKRVLMCGCLAILLGLNAACDQLANFLPSTVTVANNTNTTLASVEIKMAGEILWQGSLAPGESHKVSGRPSEDGTIEIAFTDQGHVFRRKFAYVTPGLNEDHKITILPSLEIQYTR